LVVAARFRKKWSTLWLTLAALLGSALLEAVIWNRGGYVVLSALVYLVALLLLGLMGPQYGDSAAHSSGLVSRSSSKG